jgi:hypothetical protein
VKASEEGKVDAWGMVEARAPRIDNILWDYGGGSLSEDGSEAIIARSRSIRANEYVAALLTRHGIHPSVRARPPRFPARDAGHVPESRAA